MVADRFVGTLWSAFAAMSHIFPTQAQHFLHPHKHTPPQLTHTHQTCPEAPALWLHAVLAWTHAEALMLSDNLHVQLSAQSVTSICCILSVHTCSCMSL